MLQRLMRVCPALSGTTQQMEIWTSKILRYLTAGVMLFINCTHIISFQSQRHNKISYHDNFIEHFQPYTFHTAGLQCKADNNYAKFMCFFLSFFDFFHFRVRKKGLSISRQPLFLTCQGHKSLFPNSPFFSFNRI